MLNEILIPEAVFRERFLRFFSKNFSQWFLRICRWNENFFKKIDKIILKNILDFGQFYSNKVICPNCLETKVNCQLFAESFTQ